MMQAHSEELDTDRDGRFYHSNGPAPERSLIQRMDALQRANVIRSYRAELKRDIKAGRKSAIDIITNPPYEVDTMKLFDLLLSAPKLGRVKVNKMFTSCRISPSKHIGGLSDRQRDEILRMLRR